MHNQEFINLDEFAWCSVRLSTALRFLVGVIYRKPTANTEYDNHILEEIPRSTGLKFTLILILGDFDLPKVNFAQLSYIEGVNSAEDLGLFENLKLATHWRNCQTIPRSD